MEGDALFRGFVEWAPDAIVITAADGRMVVVNHQAEQLFGYETGELLDQPVELLLREAHRRSHLDHRARYNAARRIRPMGTGLDLVGQRKDGSYFPVEISLGPAEGADGPLVISIIRDISERKRMEREREQLAIREQMSRAELERQKDEFLASISHDLRTPLTAIMASIGVVLANEPPGTPPPLHRMFVNIDLAAGRMARLVGDLLELTRLQAGRVEFRPVSCDLCDLVRRSVRSMEPLASARNQKIRVDLPAEPFFVRVDPDRLERALLNLLDNAQKYGTSGGAIGVRLDPHPEEVVLAVSNDGPGIPETERLRIFDRFYRSETEAIRRNQGSGLGLAIARAMVELHGGRIWVESAPGRGTTFSITIPRTTSPSPPRIEQESP